MNKYLKALEIRPTCGGDPSRLFQVAVTVWIVFTIVVGVKAVASPVKHNSYYAFQAGAHLWWAEQDMYDGTFNEFRYGPAFAVVFSPLAQLPLPLGSLIWMWINVTAFFWSLRILVRDILPATWTPDREAVFLLLVLVASYRGIWSAQTNTLIFATVVAGIHAIQQQRWTWAAFWLAVPVHIKIWPVAAALLLIACWPRQLAVRWVCALSAIALWPLTTKWPGVVLARYHEWYQALSGPMQVRHDYRDIWTLWEAVCPPVDKPAYLVLQLSTALLAAALCLWQQRRSTSQSQLMTFVLGMWTAWQLLFGPGSERATFSLIAPLTAWAVVTFTSGSRGRTLAGAAFALTVLASIGQVERLLRPSMPIVAALHPIGVSVFAVWLVMHARHWQSVQQQPEQSERLALPAGWAPAT
jgi:hypothetical protein